MLIAKKMIVAINNDASSTKPKINLDRTVLSCKEDL